ncbi:MAG TPA: hypothetical protein VGB17_06535 [Pyrinomonadaceae bacterium]|jgi:16S rRNA C1402 (ribose-2'-O) methylase RsmI
MIIPQQFSALNLIPALGQARVFALLYADPGSGALVWQLLVAALIGATFYFRNFLSKARNLFSSKRQKADKAESSDSKSV